jgi:hypothetical protein
MSTMTVERIAKEYQRLLEEGWKPDVEEFLHHVPQALRSDCRKKIQALLAPPAEAKAPERAAKAPERPAKPAPGPQRLTREEAKRMFREMAARRKQPARA